MSLIQDGKIQIHVADIDKLETGAMALADGSRLETDALFCATRCKFIPPIKFSGIPDSDLGLPQIAVLGNNFERNADRQILQEFPILRTAPQVKTQPFEGIAAAPQEPYRLFRFCALANVTGCLTAQIQALWITAFLHSKMGCAERPVENLESEAYLHTQFCKHPSPMSYALRHADLSFDSLPFLALTLRDLGLRVNRKSDAFWEFCEPYGKDDYVGLTAEWLANQRVEGHS